MNLIFDETPNRNRCGFKVQVNGSRMQCAFSSSKTVTIPAGLHFTKGKLEYAEDIPASTFSICKNHEGRLKLAFSELSKAKG